jgi:hypothetical protein
MRVFRRLAVLTAMTASAGLLLASAGEIASASASAKPAASVHLTGGDTWVTTGPGIVAALVKNGIVPLAAAPGAQWLTLKPSPTEHFEFPVSGGKVSLSPLGGSVDHRGGIVFVNARNGKQIEVSRFTINLAKGDLTGIVNGNPKVRVPIFNLNLAHAKLKAGRHAVWASGIGLSVTKVAAGALNATLGTHLFAGGLKLGTAATVLRF